MSEKPRDYWAFWSKEAADAGSLLYARLAMAIGGDADLKALAARAKAGQPHPNMLLGAVHFLLLRGTPSTRWRASIRRWAAPRASATMIRLRFSPISWRGIAMNWRG